MPIGKPPSVWPPAVWAGLQNLRPLLDAVPSLPQFPFPQQNPQRSAFCDFARWCFTDGGHAGISDPYKKAVWLPITLSQGARFTFTPIGAVYGGLLGIDNVPAEHRGYLIVCEASIANGQYAPYTDKSTLKPQIEAMIKAGWEDPNTPRINIVGMGDGLAAALQSGQKTIAVTPYAVTVRGSSNFTAPWQVHLMNAAGAMPKATFDSLKADGLLCTALKSIVTQTAEDLFGLKTICGTSPPLALTADQHIALASEVAKRANAVSVKPPTISDFDRWFNQFGAGLDRGSAKAGWEAAVNTK